MDSIEAIRWALAALVFGTAAVVWAWAAGMIRELFWRDKEGEK